MEPGCGVQLALKMVAENLGKAFFVLSKDRSHIIRTGAPFLPSDQPSAMAENPAVFGAHLKSERQVVCFAGEKTTDRFINSVIKSNVLYICYNTSGKVRFAKAFGLHKYAATASVAYPEDFKAKIEKAKNNGGFIELLCPCPKEWEFDPSNTVVVARSGVESGIWQLYEIENKKFNFTYKPAKLEPLDIFLNLQKKFRAEQGTINRNWKLTVEDRNWEIE